jgi:hypothetical protein
VRRGLDVAGLDGGHPGLTSTDEVRDPLLGPAQLTAEAAQFATANGVWLDVFIRSPEITRYSITVHAVRAALSEQIIAGTPGEEPQRSARSPLGAIRLSASRAE